MVANVVSHSIVKRAQDNGLVSIRIHNIRDFSDDRHRVADDTSYGGGSGMIMKAEPISGRSRRCAKSEVNYG